MSSHCFCTCVHLCVLPEGRQQQLCLIVTKPPRPQLDWSHRHRAVLVGDRRGSGGGFGTCLAKSALIWAGSRFEPTKTLWWSEGWPGFQWAVRLGLSGPPLALWTTGHRCIPLTKRWHIQLLCVSWGIFSLLLFPSMLMWLWDSFQVESSCSRALLAAGLKRLFLDCISDLSLTICPPLYPVWKQQSAYMCAVSIWERDGREKQSACANEFSVLGMIPSQFSPVLVHVQVAVL